MTATAKMEPEFIADKPVPDTDRLRFVRRAADGVTYLAKDYGSHDFPELVTLRDPSKPDDKIVAFEAAARVLNHENLISVAKPIPAQPRAGPKDTRSTGGTGSPFSLVYEYCADGNLKQLLDAPPVEATKRGFLPEGLIWHVGLSLLRALVFLHEGRRERLIMSEDERGRPMLRGRWYRPDDDWMPILHRSIRPENIHFQAARGKETYGLCKLGNFGRCVVVGTARAEREDVEVGRRHGEYVEQTQKGHLEVVAVLNNLAGYDLSQEKMMEVWARAHEGGGKPDWAKTAPVGRIYTIGSELADLGAILYRMMTGKEIEVDDCRCGCFHIDPAPPGCQCSCVFADVHLPDDLLDNKYSDGLCGLVVQLILSNRDNSARAKDCFDSHFPAYERWKMTPEGQDHYDHRDDLLVRTQAERSRRVERAKREIGVEYAATGERNRKMKAEDLVTWE